MSSNVVNRHTGEVALPEAGEGAVIQFTVKAFEQLESAYGDDYIDLIIKGLSQMKVSIYAKVIAATLQNSTNGNVPYGLKWEDLNIRILDALFLAIHGRTWEEQQAFQQEQLLKRMKGIEENPQLAAILSLMSSGKPEADPDLNQEKSVA